MNVLIAILKNFKDFSNVQQSTTHEASELLKHHLGTLIEWFLLYTSGSLDLNLNHSNVPFCVSQHASIIWLYPDSLKRAIFDRIRVIQF